MSLHRVNRDLSADYGTDCLIRWVLRSSVAGAEPSPQVWERIQQRITHEAAVAPSGAPAWCNVVIQYVLDLYLALRYPRELSGGDWQRAAPVYMLTAETSLVSGMGLRFC